MNKQFRTVCKANELAPGQMKKVTTGEGDVLLANLEGEFFAVEDLCSHEEVSLYLGCLRGDNIECSLHSGMFNLKTGEAVREPAEKALKTYRTRVWEGEIQLETY